MKNLLNITRNLTLAALTLATAALVTAPVSGLAQEKGAERLLKLNRPAATASATAAIPAMSCPKCTDTVASVAQPMAKGGRVEKATIVRHGCPSCDTKLVTQGVGKHATTIAKHDCNMNGNNDGSCCGLKKS